MSRQFWEGARIELMAFNSRFAGQARSWRGVRGELVDCIASGSCLRAGFSALPICLVSCSTCTGSTARLRLRAMGRFGVDQARERAARRAKTPSQAR